MPTLKMMNRTVRDLLIYAFAGFSFFMLAHNGFNLLKYGIDRSVGYPIHLNYLQTTAYCVEVAEHKKMHIDGWENIYHYSWLALMILIPALGFFLARKRETQLTLINWLGVFMLVVPLYRSVQTFAERVFYALIDPNKDVVSSIALVVTPKLIVIYISSLLIALYTYFVLLRKKERVWLLLVSLPIYIITYYTWFFYWGRCILPYHSPNF